jgi:hypothetical protein
MKTETLSKILIPVIIISVISVGVYLANTQYDEYTYNFYPIHLSTINNNTIASIEGCTQGNVFGWNLPSKNIELVYPNNYNISQVIITYNNTEYISIDYEPIEIIDTCIDGTYIPSNNTYYASITYRNGYPILTVNIYPVEYNEDNSTLIYRDEITVYITYSYDSDITSSELGVRDIIDVENDRWISSYDESPLNDSYYGGICNPDNIDYVIVTSDDLIDAFEPLRSFRENHSGLTSKIVSIQDILSCYDYIGIDEAERLREFCKDAYLDWNIQYMVLGGDWCQSKNRLIVPSRIFTDVYCQYSYDTMPCDLYFSNLDGNWKYNDTIWGGSKGGANDYDSEFYIGRLVVWDNNSVSNAINKIISYETTSDTEWLRSASFWGGDLGWTKTSKDYMEEIRIGVSPYATFTGFDEWSELHNNILDTSECYYDADYGYEPITQFKNCLNNNNVSVINHLDHGSWSNTLSIGYGAGISNSLFPIAMSGACLSGRYTQWDSGASALMSTYSDRGCSLLMINTGYGWGSSGSTHGATQYIQRYVWDYFFTHDQSEWTFGKALDYARDKMIERLSYNSYAWTYSWYSMNMFGDPAMKYRIPLNSITLYPYHNYIIYEGDTTSIKDISNEIGLIDGDAIAVNHSNTWYTWIAGFTPIELNENVYDGDTLDIMVSRQYEWVR